MHIYTHVYMYTGFSHILLLLRRHRQWFGFGLTGLSKVVWFGLILNRAQTTSTPSTFPLHFLRRSLRRRVSPSLPEVSHVPQVPSQIFPHVSCGIFLLDLPEASSWSSLLKIATFRTFLTHDFIRYRNMSSTEFEEKYTILQRRRFYRISGDP